MLLFKGTLCRATNEQVMKSKPHLLFYFISNTLIFTRFTWFLASFCNYEARIYNTLYNFIDKSG